MKHLGEASTDCEILAETAIKSNTEWVDEKVLYEPTAASVVSPIHRGVESACFNLEIGDKTYFMKVRQPDMEEFFDDTSAIANNRSAGDCGVAPSVFFDHPRSGTMVFEHLGDAWHWGRVDNLSDPKILENTVHAKKRLHENARFESTKSVFDKIEAHWDIIEKNGITVSSDIPEILLKIRQISKAIAAAGIDLAPCHGDGVASNVMIGPAGQVKLVDYDNSGKMDPYYDLGSLILEAFQFPSGAFQALEIYDGTFCEAHYNRCRLYGIADDLMWSFWGIICASSSSRKDVEFMKYSEWRLLRARWNLGDPKFDHWVSHL